MLLQDRPPLHLTYCLNIHPGERWAEAFAAIDTHARKVKAAVAPRVPFGLGLRLGAAAARELHRPERLVEFRRYLDRQGFYVFTINGFPYGRFHGAPVKEKVYSPDWREARRRDYTLRLADILAGLLPEGVAGSISTVPCSYKEWIRSPRQVQRMAANLTEVAAHLARIRRRTGRDICLALEPEPDCCIETTEEAIGFLRGPLMVYGRKRLTALGMPRAAAEDCLRRHVGVCLDAAHAAVQFEDLAWSLRRFREAGVRVGKVQLSAAMSLSPGAASLRKLEEFRDKVYLHQVKARCAGGEIRSYADLPDALAPGGLPALRRAEARVHFHVPLFWGRLGPLASTASLMTGEFWKLLAAGAADQLEIETYTFGVLPARLRTADVADSIIREYRWVLSRLRAAQSAGKAGRRRGHHLSRCCTSAATA